MSNDLATMFSGNLVPVEGLDDDTLAVAGGARQGNKRISIKGGVFRKYAGGKEIGAIEDRHMNVIFVKMAHKASRMFYEGAYQEGQKISPACWSTDSETPDAEVKSPIASSCRDCDKSAKGSGQSGTGTACRLSWRTAVVLPNDPAGDVMQLVLPQLLPSVKKILVVGLSAPTSSTWRHTTSQQVGLLLRWLLIPKHLRPRYCLAPLVR